MGLGYPYFFGSTQAIIFAVSPNHCIEYVSFICGRLTKFFSSHSSSCPSAYTSAISLPGRFKESFSFSSTCHSTSGFGFFPPNTMYSMDSLSVDGAHVFDCVRNDLAFEQATKNAKHGNGFTPLISRVKPFVAFAPLARRLLTTKNYRVRFDLDAHMYASFQSIDGEALVKESLWRRKQRTDSLIKTCEPFN